MNKKSLLKLAMLAAAWLTGGSAQAWDEPAQDANGVYQIGTASELEWFSEFVADNSNGETAAVLTADLDFTGVTHTPIGPNKNAKFNGSFDGQYHHIKNLVINTTNNYQGIFGWVRGGSTIKNFTIDATCSFTGGDRTAAVVATLNANAGKDSPMQILNIVNHANVNSASGAVSAFIGASDNAVFFKIHNCVNTGNIKTTGSGKYAVVANGWSNGNPGANSQVWNVVNTGTISPTDGTNTFFRGNYRSVQNCFDAVTTVYQSGVSAISAEDIANGRLCYLLNQGETEGISFKQQIGVDPYPMPVADGPLVYEVADYYCDGTPKGTITYSNTDGSTYDAHVQGANFVCENCNNYAFDGIESYKTPDADGFYHLATVDDVEWFSAMVNKKFHGAMKVKLDADIDFGGVPNAHRPIGTSGHKFGGIFDGQGHRIKGMVITSDIVMENRAFDGVGFFGSVRGGYTDATWGTENTDVVIENLIIDSSCSITYNNHWVAGIVGHINSMQDGGSVTIRNCGNEANINAIENANAGIVGIVEATALSLNIIGCWNTGNITATGKNIAGIFGGNSGSQATVIIKNCWNEGKIVGTNENAAITAWVGSNVGNDVSGCYNIGQVTGIEGTKSLYRGTVTNGKNNCDVQSGVQEGNAQLITADMVGTGELCYKLNGDQTDIQWTQTLDGTQDKPLPDATGDQVYVHGQIYCTGLSAPGTIYDNNGPDGVITLPHNINDEIGMCDVCYTQFQEPALVDGYYELKNAGNVEWFSAYVAAGHLDINGKLMNDIDFLSKENLHSPIGPNTASKYNGTFDGQGFRIKNMIIERPSDSNIGFFGFLRGNSANTTVKNLIIDASCSIHAYNRVGGITGSYQNGGMTITLENLINEATITAEHQDAGGIIGGHESGEPTIIIKNVLNTGTITAKNSAPYAGALCCYLGVGAGSKIENFVNLGTVNGHNGGNIGRHNIGDVTNLIDLSDTADKTQGTDSGLTTDDIASGKLAYTVGWGQLLGTDAYPTPLNETKVSYVGDAGYATLYDTTTGYELNGDVKAFVATTESTWLKLTEIESVPAGNAVVLKGTYYNKLAADLPAINIANDLKGTAAATEADGTMYVLAKVDDKVGFYKATGTIAAGKAYYQSASGVKAFYFDGDDATGISNVDANLNANDAIYNIAGQRIQKMQKGINIINGKKVLF